MKKTITIAIICSVTFLIIGVYLGKSSEKDSARIEYILDKHQSTLDEVTKNYLENESLKLSLEQKETLAKINCVQIKKKLPKAESTLYRHSSYLSPEKINYLTHSAEKDGFRSSVRQSFNKEAKYVLDIEVTKALSKKESLVFIFNDPSLIEYWKKKK